jgi:LmbE family N-acetylglucosaminyl deacetylase
MSSTPHTTEPLDPTVPLHPTGLGTIVSIWAHPDDETFLAGGTMAAAAANGQRVVCVSATCGEHGTDDPVAWPPERLAAVRRRESRAAMAVLGVHEHHWLDLPDGGLEQIDRLDPSGPLERIGELLSVVRPDTVLTFGPDGITFHPDHRTIGKWTTTAWELAGRPGRLLHAASSRSHLDVWAQTYEAWGIYMTDERPEGVDDRHLALRHELTGTALDQKLAALRAMPSQTAAAFTTLGADVIAGDAALESFVEYTGSGPTGRTGEGV